MFQEDIEKWKLGAAIPEIYHEYKIFGTYAISEIPKTISLKIDPNKNTFTFELEEFSPETIDPEVKKFIECIVDKLIHLDGFRLVEEAQNHYIWEKDAQRILQGETGIKYDKDEIKDFFETFPSYLNIS